MDDSPILAVDFASINLNDLSYKSAQLLPERLGWPLLTIQTEVKGDSKRTNERGPSLVGSLGLSC